MKPRIAITADRGQRPEAYLRAIEAAGGEPVVFEPLPDEAAVEAALAKVDGVLLTGGRDLDPALWGEEPHRETRTMAPDRQRTDLALIRLADARGVPVLGICLGIQEMAVVRGGAIHQHVPDLGGTIGHSGGVGKPRLRHEVKIEAGSLLARIVGSGPLEVNSTHHQAVREPGRGMRIVARSGDGVIEAIEDPPAGRSPMAGEGPTPGRFFLGVQWHPEDLLDEPPHRALFEALVRAAGRRRASQPAG
jgi:putative glutamine amidotransferase